MLIKATENVAINNNADSIVTKLGFAMSNILTKNGFSVSGYVAFKDNLERHDEIVQEVFHDMKPQSDDAACTL